MTDRRAAIIRLLESRDDHLPTPTRREHSTPGFVNEESPRSCSDCLANGRVMKGCDTCGGSGVISGKRFDKVAIPDALPDDGERRDPYSIDKIVPYGLDAGRHERTRERDSEIERLAAQTREPWRSPADELADANAHGEPWEIARRRMRQLYDYDALDRALELLRDAHVGAYGLLMAAYVNGWIEPSATFEAACNVALDFLDANLPDPLRAPDSDPPARGVIGKLEREAGAALREQRNARILEMAAEGAKPAEIAAACKVSVRTVYVVVSAAA